MTTYQILYWHDIPVQVRAGGRRDRASIEMPSRFQVAVDNAAMAAGLSTTDSYLAGFEWGELLERDGTPAEVVAAVAAEIEAMFSTLDWHQTAVNIRKAAENEEG